MKKFNIVLVGGGSTWTPGFVKGSMQTPEYVPLRKAGDVRY